MLGNSERNRRWALIVVAAALIGAASQSTGVAEEVDVSAAVSEKAQTGSIGPGIVVGTSPCKPPCVSSGGQFGAKRPAPPLGRAPPLGPHTTASQVGGNRGPQTVSPRR